MKHFASVVLALVGAMSCALCVFASTGSWIYAGNSYPTQAAALAAMHAVSAENALLTVLQTTTWKAGGTTYTYGAPSPIPLTTTNNCYIDLVFDTAGCYPTPAAVFQVYEKFFSASSPGCAPFGFAPDGEWGFVAPPPGSFKAQEWILTYPSCTGGVPTTGYEIGWQGTGSCPTYYAFNGTNCVNTYTDTITSNSDVALFDPIADNLTSGTSLVSNPAQLAAASHVIVGVAADSATQALVEVGGVNVGDAIQLTLSDENGPSADGAGAGYLTALPAAGTDSRTSSGVITVTAVATESGTAAAFAVYHSPTDFVRTGNVDDLTASIRSVTIGATDSTTGTSSTQTVNIVRPPVVFIHGLWGAPSNFMSSDGGVLGAFTGSIPWKISFARYNQNVVATSTQPAYISNTGTTSIVIPGNSLGFNYAATQVLPQIRAAAADYKYSSVAGGAIAATQVDVVAHSMGGTVTRSLPLLSGYAGQDTYQQGYVHKLITIDTPHQGTPVANKVLAADNSCVQGLFAYIGLFAINTAVVNNATVSGAVGDLQLNSAAIGNLQNLPTAMIGGSMTTAQLGGAGQSLAGAPVHALCGTLLNNPLAVALNTTSWLGVVGGASDAIVPLSSQFNGNLAYSITTSGASQNTFPAIHSASTGLLGFLGPSVLDEASGVPAQVINLLNTPVTNAGVFVAEP